MKAAFWLAALLVVAGGTAVAVARGEREAPGGAPGGAPEVTRIGAMAGGERAAHQATLLADGRVLVTGGCAGRGCESALASAEIFDPAGRSFRATSPMGAARASHAAAPLPGGRVLVSGGWTGDRADASAEVFDPATGRWTPVGRMAEARVSHIAVPLRDGRVLVAGGGQGKLANLATAEIFDPATATFSPLPPMRESHYLATRLADGRVLLTGGLGRGGEILRSAELFDPATGRFLPTGAMAVPRVKHAAALLADGRVLIAGGSDGRGYAGRMAGTEIYDPATGTFSAGPRLVAGRHKLRDAIVTLPSGAVLVAGGAPVPELFDPARRTLAPVRGTLGGPQMFATATLLRGGDVLVLGGYDERIQPSAGAWIVPGR